MAWRLQFPVDEAVEVVATHVERTTGNFFVQLNNEDSSKLDELMEDIASYVTANANKSNKARNLKVGDVCLAKYVDELWYRGKVLALGKNEFKIFFVDYGNSDLVDSKHVILAPDKFLNLCPQAFECELANVKPIGGQWGVELLTKLEELIIEQTFVAQATSLKTNNVLVLSLFKDATMTTLVVEPLILAGYLERSNEVLSSVDSKPLRKYKFLELDSFIYEDVNISHLENPNKFFCLLLKNTTALHKLMADLEVTYCEATEDDYPLQSCCQDNPCCAKYSEDDMWYRAIISSECPSTSGEIEVQFVDYGNFESVHISNLMALDERFLELPMQALECSLYGIKPKNNKGEWSKDAISMFESLTDDKHLVAFLSSVTDNAAEVFLFDTSDETKDINFAQVLVDKGQAIAVKPLNDYKKIPHFRRRKSSFGIIDLVPNTSEPVVVTNADSPSDFYCQLLKHAADLEQLMINISEYYESIGDIDDTINLPQAGMLCCCKYTEDDSWYRALILSSDIANRQVEVLYVDYGNIETLSITRIKELKPQFASLPQQAVPCSLYGLSPPGPDWPEKAIEEFQTCIVDKELLIKVVSQSESQRYNVSLLETVGDEEYSINKQLVQKGYAVSEGDHPGVSVETDFVGYQPPALEISNYIDVEVTHVENLDRFWCHLTTLNDDMENLMSNLQSYYDANPPKTTDSNLFSQGSPCCARFSEDEMWYRGKILDKMSNNRFKVRFVDYGNCEIVTSKSVAALTPEFLQLPVQAILCSLANVSSSDKKKNDFIHRFLDMVDGKDLVCRLDDCDNQGKYVVLLIDTNEGDGVNINEEMVTFIATDQASTSKEPLPAKHVPKSIVPSITIGKEEAVYITCINNPKDFYCQLATTSTQLDSLMDNMESYYRPMSPHEDAFSLPSVGDICCAMFTEDNGFYRAVVTKATGSSVGVRYLDYGNHEELPVSRIKVLNASFTELPAQCFHATSSFSGSNAEFEQEVLDKELKAMILKQDDDGVYVVRLSDASGNVLFPSGNTQPQQDFFNGCNITRGDQLDVCASYCESPNLFYIQLVEKADVLDQIMGDLNEVYSDLRAKDQAIANPAVGMVCAAKYSVDNSWYRAEILSIPSPREFEVCYIDFGNCERVGLHDVKILAPAFYSTAVQAVKCRLAGAKNTWSSKECEKFEKLVVEQHLIATVESVDLKMQSLSVVLHNTRNSEDVNILEVLLDKSAVQAPVKVPKLASLPKLQLKDVENVLVESAESLDSFVCQFTRLNHDLDKMADMMYEIYHEGTPPGFVTTPLQKDDVIAALFSEDDTWYRATVSEVKSDGSLQVMFIDYGNSETIPVNAISRRVRHLSKDLLRFPFMRGVTCSLSRTSLDGQQYSWTPRAHDAFAHHVVEKEFRARLGSNCEPYQVVLEDKSGSIHAWLAREKLVGNAEPEVVQEDFYEIEMEAGMSCDVYVTSVVNPEKFYVQLAANGEAIDKVMDDLHVSCTDGSRGTLMNITSGTLCAAQYSVDDAWYRARVTRESSPNSFEVTFVDYGNSEVLPKERLRELNPALLELPVQGICCCLQLEHPRAWDEQTNELFETSTADKCLKISVVDVIDGKLVVKMTDQGSSVNDIFESVVDEKAVEISPYSVTAKQEAEVYVSHLTSPKEFYVQFSSCEEALEKLAEDCAAIYDGPDSGKYKMDKPQKGMFCCARYSEDGAWYRAQIISIDDAQRTASVLFVDHGNTDVINLLSDLRVLTADLSKLPCQAIPCSLGRRTWSPEQCSTFEASVMDKPLRATFTEHVDSTWLVILQDGNSVLNQLLVASQEEASNVQNLSLAPQEQIPVIKRPVLSVGDEPSVYLISVDSPKDVILQLSSRVPDLEALMNDIANEPPQSDLKNIEKGMYCLARFTEDDAWYRAKVLESDGDKIKVCYVDYGNEEYITCERLAPISERLSHLPEVSIRCSFDQSIAGNLVENFGEQLLEIYGENELCCQLVSETSQGFSVKLFCGDEDVLSKLLLSSESIAGETQKSEAAASFVYTAKQLKVGDRKDVVCSYVETPRKLWCQLVDDQEILDDLMNRLGEVYSALGAEELLVERCDIGAPCCGQFLEDDGWYRAEIVGKEDEGVKVRYVDYGNEEILPLSRLRSLKPEFLTTPRQAVAWLLKDVQANGDEWSPDAFTFVESFIENSLVAEVKDVDELAVAGVIYGSVEGSEVSLNDQLVEKSFAIHPVKQATKKEADIAESYGIIAESYRNIPTDVGDKINLFYVSAESPASIWCQLSDTENELLELMEQLGAFYGNLSEEEWALGVVEVGAVVCAQFTEDDSWYRAEILKTTPSIVVRYVDYGNCEELPRSRIKLLKKEFAVLPKQAISLSLGGVSPLSLEEWSEEKNALMEELCAEQCYVGEIVSVNETAIRASLRELESQMLLLEKLIEEGLVKQMEEGAVASEAVVEKSEMPRESSAPLDEAAVELPFKYLGGEYEPNGEYLFYLLSVESPNCIWLQDTRGEESLQRMQSKMQDFYSSESASVLSGIQIGSACCALFEEEWYRAEVRRLVDEDRAEVLFVDWGNSDSFAISELKELAPDFKQLPRQAVSVSLSGFSSSKEWSASVVESLNELCDFDSMTARVVEICDEKLIVQLYNAELGEKSVNERLQESLPTDVSTVVVETAIAEVAKETLSSDVLSSTNDNEVTSKSCDGEIPTNEILSTTASADDEAPLESTSADEEVPSKITTADGEGPLETRAAAEEIALETASADDEAPLQTTTADEEVPSKITTADGEGPLETGTAAEEVPLETRTAADETLLETTFADDEGAPKTTTGDGESPVEAKTASEEVAVETTTSDDKAALESTTADDDVSSKTTTADGEVPLETKTSAEEVLLGTTTADEETPLETKIADAEAPSIVTSVGGEGPLETGTAAEELQLESTATDDETPLETTIADDETPSELTSVDGEGPLETRTAAEELQLERATTDDETPLETTIADDEAPSKVTTAVGEGPFETRIAAEELQLETTSTDDEASLEAEFTDGVVPSKTTPSNGQTVSSDSPADSVEDLNDPELVCDAINRLVTEIDSRVATYSSNTNDIQLDDDAEQRDDTACNADEIASGTNEFTYDKETLFSSEENSVALGNEVSVASALTTEQSDDSSHFQGDSIIEEQGDEAKERVTDDESASLDEIERIEFSTLVPKPQESAPESDLTTDYKNMPSILHSKSELTNESPSDEASASLTRPNELETETGKEEQGLLSSPEIGDIGVARYTYPEIKLGDIHKVTISHIQSPSSFFCQLSRTAVELTHLMQTIQERTESVDTLASLPNVGVPCVALDNDLWHRAVVRDAEDDDHVIAMLVDIGKTISLPLAKLKAIADEIVTSLPRQALHCSLVDLEPANTQWSADAVTKMAKVCDGKELEGIFRSRHHKVYDIYLRDAESDSSDFVNKLLVDLKLAKVAGRDSDESTELNGNGEMNAVLKMTGNDKDELPTGSSTIDENEQSVSSAVKTDNAVSEFLDSILEKAIAQAVLKDVHEKEQTDVLGVKNAIKDCMSCAKMEIEDESNLNQLNSGDLLKEDRSQTVVSDEERATMLSERMKDNVVLNYERKQDIDEGEDRNEVLITDTNGHCELGEDKTTQKSFISSEDAKLLVDARSGKIDRYNVIYKEEDVVSVSDKEGGREADEKSKTSGEEVGDVDHIVPNDESKFSVDAEKGKVDRKEKLGLEEEAVGDIDMNGQGIFADIKEECGSVSQQDHVVADLKPVIAAGESEYTAKIVDESASADNILIKDDEKTEKGVETDPLGDESRENRLKQQIEEQHENQFQENGRDRPSEEDSLGTEENRLNNRGGLEKAWEISEKACGCNEDGVKENMTEQDSPDDSDEENAAPVDDQCEKRKIILTSAEDQASSETINYQENCNLINEDKPSALNREGDVTISEEQAREGDSGSIDVKDDQRFLGLPGTEKLSGGKGFDNVSISEQQDGEGDSEGVDIKHGQGTSNLVSEEKSFADEECKKNVTSCEDEAGENVSKNLKDDQENVGLLDEGKSCGTEESDVDVAISKEQAGEVTSENLNDDRGAEGVQDDKKGDVQDCIDAGEVDELYGEKDNNDAHSNIVLSESPKQPSNLSDGGCHINGKEFLDSSDTVGLESSVCSDKDEKLLSAVENVPVNSLSITSEKNDSEDLINSSVLRDETFSSNDDDLDID